MKALGGVLIFKLIIIILCLSYSVRCIQTLYKFIPEHCEITNVNKSLVDMKIGKCSKVSRSELYLNVSFTIFVDILNDHMGQVKITGYQFRSNEYRKGPIEFMLGICKGLTLEDYDIPHMYANSNMRCPYKKGRNYYVYNLSPNATNMPPLIPEGKWKLQVDYIYINKHIMFSVEWYSAVEYFLHL